MKKNPLQRILFLLRRYFTTAAYRTFIRLLFRYRNVKRYQEHEVHCFGFTLHIPDVPSFIYQFKDIFVEEHYRFTASDSHPVIIDCGANVGVSCLYFKHLFPGSRITALEADPKIAAFLNENLKKNGAQNVTVIEKALWKNNDGVEFAADGADGGSVFGSALKITIPSVRLSEIITGAGHVDLLKMDIEGAETEVIVECKDTLHNVDRIYIEYHAWKNLPQTFDVLLSVLTNAKFRYYIQSISEVANPLVHDGTIPNTDLQLHLFAVRQG